MFVLYCVCYAFVRVCLYVPCDHLLGKGWPCCSRLLCLTVSLSFSIGILGQVWYLIVSIPDLCTLAYFKLLTRLWNVVNQSYCRWSLLVLPDKKQTQNHKPSRSNNGYCQGIATKWQLPVELSEATTHKTTKPPSSVHVTAKEQPNEKDRGYTSTEYNIQ